MPHDVLTCEDALPFSTSYALHVAQLCEVILAAVTLILIIVVLARKEFRCVPVHSNLKVTFFLWPHRNSM